MPRAQEQERTMNLPASIQSTMATLSPSSWKVASEGIAEYLGCSACTLWSVTTNEGLVCLASGIPDGAPDVSKKHLEEIADTCHSSADWLLIRDAPESAWAESPLLEQTSSLVPQTVAAVSQDQEPKVLILVLWQQVVTPPRNPEPVCAKDLTLLLQGILPIVALRYRVYVQERSYDDYLRSLGHELGAPLATLYDALSLVEIEGAGRRHLIPDMKSLVLYAHELISTLHTSSRATHTEYERDEIPQNQIRLFQDVIYPIASTMAFWLRRKHMDLNISFDPVSFPSSFAFSDQETAMIRGVFFNLLDNAVKYTPPGTAHDIRIQGYVESEMAIISVANWGVGIPKGEEHLAFAKESKCSNAHNCSISGRGMGLHIASAFMRAMAGEISLKRNVDPTELLVAIPMRRARYEYRSAHAHDM